MIKVGVKTQIGFPLGVGQDWFGVLWVKIFESITFEIDYALRMLLLYSRQASLAIHTANLLRRSLIPTKQAALKELLADNQLVEQVLSNPSLIQPKQAHVTLLFLDLRNSTALVDLCGIEPSLLASIMNEFHTQAKLIVKNHRGISGPLIGDGFMATFGSLKFTEKSDNYVYDAINCAWQLSQWFETRIADWKSRIAKRISACFESLQLGMGIATGQAVVGNFGSEVIEFNALGRAPTLASRICQEARVSLASTEIRAISQCIILLDECTLQYISDLEKFEIRLVKSCQFPGFPGTFPLHQLVRRRG